MAARIRPKEGRRSGETGRNEADDKLKLAVEGEAGDNDPAGGIEERDAEAALGGFEFGAEVFVGE